MWPKRRYEIGKYHQDVHSNRKYCTQCDLEEVENEFQFLDYDNRLDF